MQTNIYFGNNTFSHLEALKNLNTDVKYSECLKSKFTDFRQCQNPNASQLGFQHIQISDIQDFWDTHKMFRFQRVQISDSV